MQSLGRLALALQHALVLVDEEGQPIPGAAVRRPERVAANDARLSLVWHDELRREIWYRLDADGISAYAAAEVLDLRSNTVSESRHACAHEGRWVSYLVLAGLARLTRVHIGVMPNGGRADG
jgi:hypothetical protein